jgi:hypothetical protein
MNLPQAKASEPVRKRVWGDPGTVLAVRDERMRRFCVGGFCM